MLKYIKVKNFLSFRDETVISFESDNRGNKKENVFKEKNTYLNKSTLIYGANSSGKTNILKVVDFIRYVALSSVNGQMKTTPFLLDESAKNECSSFEIGYFNKGREYKYAFSILGDIFLDEKFSKLSAGKEIILFYRNGDKKIITQEKKFQREIDKGEGKVKPTASFMSVLGQWNGQVDKEPINKFFFDINILPSSLDTTINPYFTTNFLGLKGGKNKDLVVEFLKCADINIDDVRIIEVERPITQINGIVLGNSDTLKVKENVVQFGHKVKGSDDLQYFDVFTVESGGTRKLFMMLGLILDTIINEKMLFIDEVECNLHPHILKNIFNLIHLDLGRKYQFICTTHSLEFMDLNLFKKSQIGITQKKKNNSTEFYTIEDFADIRSENDIKKLYNVGFLGGVPYTSDLSILIKEMQKGRKS